MRSQATKPVDSEAFEFWKKDPVTQSVMRALGLFAQDLKLQTLAAMWDTNDVSHGREIMTIKEAGKAQVMIVSQVINLDYDQYASYFEEAPSIPRGERDAKAA